jgi:diguanylate cyclase (GGDEF)-like protein/PAS domain S-box-containing protein
VRVLHHRASRRRRLPRPGRSGSPRRLYPGRLVAQDDLRAILNSLPAMVGYWDADLRNHMANDAYSVFVGRTPEQMRGIHIRDVLGPERFPLHHPHMLRALAGEPQRFDSMIVGDDGSVRDTQVHYTPDIVDGTARGFFVLVTDITARRDAERAIQGAEARFRTLFEFAPIGTFLVDAEGRILDVNRAGAELVGATPERLMGSLVSAITHPDDRASSRESLRQLMAGEIESYTIEKRYVHAGGHTIWAQLNVTPLPSKEGLIALAQIQDISERRRHEAELRELADRDAMSGMFNHRAFMLQVERQAATADRHGTGGALLLIDLDGFKEVNDTRGHRAGDELIVEVAELLRRRVRVTDVVGRVGGDEFAVIAPYGDVGEARKLAQALVEILRDRPDPLQLRIAASIGVAPFDQGRSAEQVLAAADAAMYLAKRAGGDRVAVHAATES